MSGRKARRTENGYAWPIDSAEELETAQELQKYRDRAFEIGTPVALAGEKLLLGFSDVVQETVQRCRGARVVICLAGFCAHSMRSRCRNRLLLVRSASTN